MSIVKITALKNVFHNDVGSRLYLLYFTPNDEIKRQGGLLVSRYHVTLLLVAALAKRSHQQINRPRKTVHGGGKELSIPIYTYYTWRKMKQTRLLITFCVLYMTNRFGYGSFFPLSSSPYPWQHSNFIMKSGSTK